MVLMIALAFAATSAPELVSRDYPPDLVFRFQSWPPTTKSDQRRARTVRKLLSYCESKFSLKTRGDAIEFPIWLEAPTRVFKMFNKDLSAAQLAAMKKQFPKLSIEYSDAKVFALGSEREVARLEKHLKTRKPPDCR